MARNTQAGEGRVGFFITLVVFGIAAFLAVKIIPVRISGYQFREVLREEARVASVQKNDSDLANRIIDRAAELEIPLTRKNLQIKRTVNQVTITASYEQPIDLKFTTYTYRFESKQSAPLF